jgi:prepilin-type N-terminal cleavage/methylation domain-containing protein
LAFTLIELLTVIAVIAVIAALILPVGSAVRRQAFIHNAQAQMSQLQTALERYKSAYGFYPPASLNGPLTNQLYYELVGTTNIAPPTALAPIYQPLGNPSQQLTASQVNGAFGVNGFMNCAKPGGDESAQPARNFLPDLNTNQISAVTVGGTPVNLLVTPSGGPDPSYNPLGPLPPDHIGSNPWRYGYPGTNNPGSYDLWIQLDIAGSSNLICNWTKSVQINNNSVP